MGFFNIFFSAKVVACHLGVELASGSMSTEVRRVKEGKHPHVCDQHSHIVRMPQLQSQTHDMLPSKK